MYLLLGVLTVSPLILQGCFCRLVPLVHPAVAVRGRRIGARAILGIAQSSAPRALRARGHPVPPPPGSRGGRAELRRGEGSGSRQPRPAPWSLRLGAPDVHDVSQRTADDVATYQPEEPTPALPILAVSTPATKYTSTL